MGLSFYSYKECPTCQCISASDSSAASTSSQREETIPLASNNKVDNPPEVTKPVIKNIKSDSGRQYSEFVDKKTGKEIPSKESDDEKFDWAIWLDEHWRLLFAGTIAVIVFGIAIISTLIPKTADIDGELKKDKDDSNGNTTSSASRKQELEVIKESTKETSTISASGSGRDHKDHRD
jgi:hypothetical protein